MIRRIGISFLSLILAFLPILFIPKKVDASIAPAIRVVAGSTAERAVVGMAQKAGIKYAEKKSMERAVQRWNMDLYNAMKEQTTPIVTRSRAEALQTQLNRVPTPVSDKPGWGKIAVDTALFLTGLDILYEGYQAFERGMEQGQQNYEYVVNTYPTEGESVVALGDFTQSVVGKFIYAYFKGTMFTGWSLDSVNSVSFTSSEFYPSYVYLYFTLNRKDGTVDNLRTRYSFPSGTTGAPANDNIIASAPAPSYTANTGVLQTYPLSPPGQPKPEIYPNQEKYPEIVEILVPITPTGQPGPLEEYISNPEINVPILPKQDPLPIPDPLPFPEPVPEPVSGESVGILQQIYNFLVNYLGQLLKYLFIPSAPIDIEPVTMRLEERIPIVPQMTSMVGALFGPGGECRVNDMYVTLFGKQMKVMDFSILRDASTTYLPWLRGFMWFLFFVWAIRKVNSMIAGRHGTK